MRITTEIRGDVRWHTVRGAIDVGGVRTYLKGVYESSAGRSEASVVWDLREADFSSVTSEEVRALMEFVGRNWGTEGKSRAALVVTQDLDFGMSRMYQIMLERATSSRVAVFRDMREAAAWITAE